MRQTAWRSATEWPLTAAAGLFLLTYGWQVLAQPEGAQLLLTEVILWATWALFAVDYVANLVLAPVPRRWFWRHLHELLIVALPVLRPLRLLRLISVLALVNRVEEGLFRGRIVLYAVGSSLLLIVVAGLAMLDVERDAPDATITTFGDALWWAVVTITTVGYGDLSPVTLAGRFIAVAVMVAGIALLGTITASLASWFLDRVSSAEAKDRADAKSDMDRLTREVAELRAVIVAQRHGITAPARPVDPGDIRPDLVPPTTGPVRADSAGRSAG
ncbi:potassium channel family protein [Planctomonas psychrotolerans]|uniref:potassium channel family protein n=1 Tax=Planctomonas psychrotolerans TaxID=2528712 RepID=UPI00123ADD10|nr:potassium channel family protein [Planctomonas psychrotolerans]